MCVNWNIDLIIGIGIFAIGIHVKICCVAASASLVIALKSGRNEATVICSAKLGVALGCVGEGGGVAVAAWCGLLPLQRRCILLFI